MTEVISSDMTLSGLETAEQVYAVFGVCRSGTTAIEKLLTLDGIPAYHQPIKTSLLKGITEVNLAEHQALGSDSPRITIKETLGAYSTATSTFNPLEVIRTNVPDDRLHTVFTIKDPFNNFLSWMSMVEMAPPKSGRQINTEELLGYYILSSQTLFDIFEESRNAGIHTTVFDYNALNTQSGTTVAQRLLSELGVEPGSYNTESWSSQGSVRDNQSGIIHLGAGSTNALHDQLDASQGLQYCPPDPQRLPADMHASVRAQLTDEGLYDAYQQMLQHPA